MQLVASIGKGWVVGRFDDADRPTANGMHAHNFAARKELFHRHRFRTDLGRTLAALLLYKEWSQDGARVIFAPAMQVAHAFTWVWWLHHYHFRLGYEVYRLMRIDTSFANRWVRRTGIAQPLLHFAMYVVQDVPRWLRYSRAVDLSTLRRWALLPLLSALSLVARGAEAAGMLATIISPLRMKRWAETA